MAMTPKKKPRAGSPLGAARRSVVRDNGLSLVLAACFLAFWAAQAEAGHRVENRDRAEKGEAAVSFGAYVASPHFWQATSENWESEFLQMGVYVLFTVFLFQRGSAESKDPDKPAESVDREPDPQDPRAPAMVRRGGFSLKLYSSSLTLAFVALFLVAWLVHALSGARLFQQEHGAPLTEYLRSSQFWFESFQNWQSEFLAVLSMVVLSIFLRQKGSPESKPVDAPHSKTGG
jgi:hypothetical protein